MGLLRRRHRGARECSGDQTPLGEKPKPVPSSATPVAETLVSRAGTLGGSQYLG